MLGWKKLSESSRNVLVVWFSIATTLWGAGWYAAGWPAPLFLQFVLTMAGVFGLGAVVKTVTDMRK